MHSDFPKARYNATGLAHLKQDFLTLKQMGFWTTTETDNFNSTHYVRIPEMTLKFQCRRMAMLNNHNSGEEFQTFNPPTPQSSTLQKLTILRLPHLPPKKTQYMSYCAAGLSFSGIFFFTSCGFSDVRGTLILPSCFRRILP